MPCAILLAVALAATDRHPITHHEAASPAASSSAGFWLGAGGIAVVLAVFGAVSLLAKKARPRDSADLRVVGRASLSPRHAVYLLRVGDRTLIVGTGGQGAPSLLGELAPSPEPPSSATHRPTRLATTIGGPA